MTAPSSPMVMASSAAPVPNGPTTTPCANGTSASSSSSSLDPKRRKLTETQQGHDQKGGRDNLQDESSCSVPCVGKTVLFLPAVVVAGG